MSQGKGWDQKKVIRTLEPFFKLGCNTKKACDYAGIPYTTVHTWISNDEELRIKVTAWQNEMSVLARRNWKAEMEKGSYQAADNWLSKKEKDEFSSRQEHSGPEGGAIIILPASLIEKNEPEKS